MCDGWIHLKCTVISPLESYLCQNCYSELFPFQTLDDKQLLNEMRSDDKLNFDINHTNNSLFPAKCLQVDNKMKSLIIDLDTGLDDSKYCSQTEAHIINKNCKFFLLCMNIRSLNANFHQLNELLTNYDILADIIAMSETKPKLSQVYNAKLSGYHFYHKGTTTSRGGVGLFIKESLLISICKEFDLNIPNCEDMWIQLDLGNNKKCIVEVIYRHPKQKLSEFCNSFESTVEKFNSRKLKYYIGGDFNADLLKSNSDTNIKDFMNLMYSLGCIPLITHPTRITTTSSTLLDHVHTNNVLGEHKSFILVEDVSDHLPVMVCSNLSLPKITKSTVTLIRDTKNFDIEKFLDKLTEGMELLGNIKLECIDNYTEKFIDIFHKTLNIQAPLRKQSRKETKLKNKPWLSKRILKSIQQKIYCTKEPSN